MLLSIEPDGPPIYQQIRDRIVEAIARGLAAIGDFAFPATAQARNESGSPP